MNQDYANQTKLLIDNLKGICARYGLGNDGNEFKIITQSFLYKYLNDKFGHEAKRLDPKLAASENWEKDIAGYSENDYNLLLARMSPGSARLRPEHFISYLFNHQTMADFASLFDDTLRDIATRNNAVFSAHDDSGASILLFDTELSKYISSSSERSSFCRAIINQLSNVSFEHIFSEGFDFFSTIFEYMIKDYNKDSGQYAEYYTPHAVAKIMAQVLVDDGVSNVTCYDPSAGSGTLLMNLAHAIGPDKCSIYSQDISQKSSGLLRLNLILNDLAHSINHVIQGDTILKPAHINDKFDYIVSNPPFKLDFSDYQPELSASKNTERFFAGIPKIPKAKKDSMAIYLLFIQHIMYSLSENGKAAVVVPTGFLTAQNGIELKIREKLVNEHMLRGVISMPSNIFATTNTNVSILFIDKANTKGDIMLVDASNLGSTTKEGKNKKTVLSTAEENTIIEVFKQHSAIDDFSAVVSYEKIASKNFSLSAGQYFEIKILHTVITPEAFTQKMDGYITELSEYFDRSAQLETELRQRLKEIRYD
ncbi:MAG: methylase [Candidatus Saccharibacteria bacterium]|nr:methylase [Candidatus Saccharibacteria bacterium]